LTGIPVSIGIGHSKTQAKYASTIAKQNPHGVFLTSEMWWEREVAAISIGNIWGVGRRLKERYLRFGINTCADMRIMPPHVIKRVGGVVGIRLRQELLGSIAYPIITNKPLSKSIMSSRSFGTKTSSLDVIFSALSHHAHLVIRSLEEKSLSLKIFLSI